MVYLSFKREKRRWKKDGNPRKATKTKSRFLPGQASPVFIAPAITSVNFLSRVASNLENGPEWLKMRADEIMDRLSKMLGAGFMASSLLFVGTLAFATDGEIKSDLKELR